MPAIKVDYVPLPYVGPRYENSGHGRTLADLMLQRGNQEAALHLQRGDNAARAWQGAGQSIMGAVNDWQQRVEYNRQAAIDNAREARRAEAEGLQIKASKGALEEQERRRKGAETARAVMPLARRENGVYGYDRDVIAREMEAAGHGDMLPDVFAKLDEQEAGYLKVQEARTDAVAADAWRVLQGGAADAETVGELMRAWKENNLVPASDLKLFEKAMKQHGPERALMAAVQSSPRMAQMLQQMEAANAPKLHNVPEGATVIDERNPQAGPLFTAPRAEKAPTDIEAAILQARASGDKAAVDELVGIKERMARAGRAPAPAPAAEPLQAVIGDDGRPVLVPRSEAVGKQPASTRETGRQVTSGDAGDIAEFNTALDDVATLKAALAGNQATGAAANIGANVPNWATELTGWGTDAKQKQAVIDRVKQVIGKALEGGVLRKEDEAKYAKILPTIGDPTAVVEAKLAGLEAALQRRQERKIDALDSAGYDVSKFRRPAADGWQEIDGIRIRVKPGGGD
jgi:hypothetical protein